MKTISSSAGDELRSLNGDMLSDGDKKRFAKDIITSLAALTCLAAGKIYTKVFPEQDVIAGIIYFVGVAIIGVPIAITAIKGFIKQDISASMETLVFVAVAVCVLDGEYTVAILIPIILTVVHFLEEKSIMGGREALDGLKKMQSKTAIKLVNGAEVEVDAKSLVPGDMIAVKPGAALSVDGTVVSGATNMDQKSLTGESLPKETGVGDTVYAGTVNIDGEIKVRVEKAYSDTSFSKIVELLENAENMTMPETRIVDRFMVYYIPMALIIATLVWLFTKDISKAVAVLVVSCPCGYMLVSSAPVIAALAASSKRGILIKKPSFIERLAETDYFVFDKTGTVTGGTLEAVGVHLTAAESEDELITASATVANGSLHPTSRSILKLADGRLDEGYNVTEEVGRGVRGKKDGSEIILGSRRFLMSEGFEVTDEFEADGACSWVAKDGKLLGCIVFRDIPRPEAAEALKELKSLGIVENCMLTGDNSVAAKRVGDEIGFDTVKSRLLPEQKLENVKLAKVGHTVTAVGDGINDSPALGEADVGIAMGAMGSDTAIASADIALMNNDLRNLPFLVRLCRKTKKTIYANIVIAFSISFVMIFLAAAGVISPVTGAFLHNIGAFIVLLNSGRILK
ncbi:MAG: cation-translocating P-type ATPase [Oscillospiraceae bacterium]|nr:cation-translocating P-type ATPase [Oscillospiraceae bacterium]